MEKDHKIHDIVLNGEDNKFQTINAHQGAVNCLKYHDGRLVSGSLDKTVKIWSFDEQSNTYKQTALINKHNDVVRKIHVDSLHLLSSSYDGILNLYDFSQPKKQNLTDPFCTIF